MQAVGKPRTATIEPGSGSLERYFGTLQGIPLLDAAKELSLAREIEALEIAHWRALLSYRPALSTVDAAFAPHTQDRPRKTGSKLSPAAAARQLRRLDVRRTGLYAVDAAVRARFAGDLRACAYLERVARARRAQQRAKGRFVAANLRLVISMAQRYRRSGMPLEDLIQEGNLGLMRAVDRFDHRRGFRFSTYAAWWIRHGLSRAVSDKARLVRIPLHALEDLARVARASEASATKTGAAPSSQELALQTGMPESKLAQLRLDARLDQPLSLDQGPGGDSDKSPYDRTPGPEPADLDHDIDLASWHDALPRLLAGLRPIEAAVLRFRFGLDDGEELTLLDIGKKYDLSRERIRQLQAEALAKLRVAIASGRRPGDSDAAA
jgi:RNA polymerase primary sigma factor